MGERFAGRFELLDPIAEGGMGSVWRVRDLLDGGVYAGKLLRHSDAGSLMRFIREQATRVEHPHVVRPLSWAGEDDRVLFTMPLIAGGSVASLIGDHGALPDAWTVRLLDQALDALAAVHAAGLVHRDVKPANLLLRPTGAGEPHLLLSDFGIAAEVDSPRLTRASQVLGSPGYMSPEQLQGADPDPRQDVYALGTVGLEMVTGLRPPQGRIGALAEPDPSPLVALLLRATASSPENRPASATALRAELADLDVPVWREDPDGPFVFDHLDGDGGPTRPTVPEDPPEDPPDGTDRRRDRDAPRRRALAVILLVVGIACAVGAWAVLFG